jgi:hypothetical protein
LLKIGTIHAPWTIGIIFSDNKITGQGSNAIELGTHGDFTNWLVKANNVNGFVNEVLFGSTNSKILLGDLAFDNIIVGSGNRKENLIDFGTGILLLVPSWRGSAPVIHIAEIHAR